MTIRVSFQGGGSSSTVSATNNFSTIYFGAATSDGSWLITTSGDNLVFQHRETGSYVEKTAITTT